MRYRARVDANQKAIVAALRKAGRSVALLHREGAGIPDIIVGNGEENVLLEIKISKGDLTPDQIYFHETWRGPIAVVRNETEAIELTCPITGKMRRTAIEKLQRMKAPLL